MKIYMLLTIWLLVLVACKGTKMPSSVDTGNNTESTRVQDQKEKDTIPSRTAQAIATDNVQYKRKDSSHLVVGDSINTTDSVNRGSHANDSTAGKGKAYLSPRISPTISEVDLRKMYKYLEMSDGQIQAFENSMQDFSEKVKYHPNGEMLGSVGNEQERQLKEGLKENQWKKYEEWKKARGQ